MKITIDLSGIDPFIGSRDITEYSKQSLDHLDALLSGKGRGADFLGWITLPEDISEQIDRISNTALRLRNQAGITVVIGIGGSYLGARAVTEALNDPFGAGKSHSLLFAGHHLSEDYLSSLTGHLEGKKFNIIVISKSGTTTEPAIAFRALKQMLVKQEGKNGAARHIVAVTDSSKGALRQMAELEGYETFIIPDNVGGRYSVFTPVGLLPVATAGYDIRSLIEGAAEMARDTRDNRNPATNIALTYASVRNLLFSSGKKIEMLVNYEPALHYLAEWWKQLFGESEGKEGKGIFPASADLTTDLHSLGQYMQDGQRIIFETVISVQNPSSEFIVPWEEENPDGLNFISGRRLSEVNSRAEEGTIEAHIGGGVPVIRLVMPEVNEKYIGQLLYFFEMACAISGYQLGVNPFDQPGVETYKKNMFRLLGKPGY